VILVINLNTVTVAADFENTFFLSASVIEEGSIADIELVDLHA